MLFNPYQFFKESPKYKKLVGDEYLFVEFKCPIEDEEFKAWSECHYIIYVLSGKKKWRTSTKEWTVEPGQSIFVRKGAYFNQLYLDEDLCVLMFFMTDRFIQSFVQEDFPHRKQGDGPHVADPIHDIRMTESLSVLYQSFFTYLNQDHRVPRRLVELKFRELLLNILNDSANAPLTQFVLDLALTDQSDLPRLMEENFYFNLRLEDFARICGRSLSSFKRDFRNHYQMSPGKWLTQRRLEHAHSLLMRTSKNVQEICYESGFENSSHFIRVFGQAYGSPPSQYRREQQIGVAST